MVDQIDFKLCALDFTSHSLVAGKFALGSGRKKEKTKHKVVPDMFTKGALVWNVQVNFTLLLDHLGDVRWTGSWNVGNFKTTSQLPYAPQYIHKGGQPLQSCSVGSYAKNNFPCVCVVALAVVWCCFNFQLSLIQVVLQPTFLSAVTKTELENGKQTLWHIRRWYIEWFGG